MERFALIMNPRIAYEDHYCKDMLWFDAKLDHASAALLIVPMEEYYRLVDHFGCNNIGGLVGRVIRVKQDGNILHYVGAP